MGLNVGNLPVKQVYVGSTPVTAVHVGAQKVWPTGPRKVTIKNTSAGGFEKVAMGDVSLIGGWPLSPTSDQGVSFAAPVTCDRTVERIDTFASVRPGATIPAGRGVTPQYSAAAGTRFVFTEVL